MTTKEEEEEREEVWPNPNHYRYELKDDEDTLLYDIMIYHVFKELFAPFQVFHDMDVDDYVYVDRRDWPESEEKAAFYYGTVIKSWMKRCIERRRGIETKDRNQRKRAVQGSSCYIHMQEDPKSIYGLAYYALSDPDRIAYTLVLDQEEIDMLQEKKGKREYVSESLNWKGWTLATFQDISEFTNPPLSRLLDEEIQDEITPFIRGMCNKARRKKEGKAG